MTHAPLMHIKSYIFNLLFGQSASVLHSIVYTVMKKEDKMMLLKWDKIRTN